MAKLDIDIRRRIVEKLIKFHGEFKKFFKLRVGDWRVFYKVDWNGSLITVSYIDHRGRAYKK